LFELNISVKIPPISEQNISQAYIDYRRRNSKRSQEILLEFIHQEIINRNMVAEGDLLESFQPVDLEETSDLSKVSVGSDDWAASVLERGARPADDGIVNVSKILRWIQAKGIVPDYGTERQMAFLVARKIGEQGQPLHGGLKRPFANAQKKAKRRIDRLWANDISKLVSDLEKA
jgi:hypothetical protein